MGIDFYWLDERGQADASLVTLSGPCETEFLRAADQARHSTGLFIDPYGTTRLSPDHGKLVLAYLEREACPSCKDVITILKKAVGNNLWLILEGD